MDNKEYAKSIIAVWQGVERTRYEVKSYGPDGVSEEATDFLFDAIVTLQECIGRDFLPREFSGMFELLNGLAELGWLDIPKE